MQHLFTFFFRLLLTFLAAKFLTRFFGLESMGYWLGLTLAFMANLYFFDWLDYRGHSIWRRRRASRQDSPASSAPPPSEETPPEA